MKSLALRYLKLYVEIADLDIMITSVLDGLTKRKAVGYECASQLLITTGDNSQFEI